MSTEHTDITDTTEPASGFDLDSTKSVADREDEGTWVHIRNAKGERLFYGEQKKPVRWRVAGTYSNLYRRADEAQRDTLTKRRSLDGEQLDNGQLGKIAACSLEWEGMFSKGAPIPLNKHNVVMVLRNAPWVREDLESAMGDHERFFSPRSID